MPQVVFTEQTGRVLTVRLDDPPRNFLGSRMVAELDTLTRRLERERSVGAVIVTSAVPGVFVTHADTPEMSRRAAAAGWAPSYRQPARSRISSAASLRALDAYHAELGPMDTAGNDDVIAAWEHLRDGTLVDMTAP